ncbi:MAG TPA: hypothetical protein VIK13_06580 [Candidatus Limnocylindrales bacterium]
MGKAEAAGGIYLVGLIALCAALGMAASSIWVGLLVFGGVIALNLASTRAIEAGSESAIWIACFGVGGISLAAQLAEYSGRWLWSIPWGLGALLLIGAAAVTVRKSGRVSMVLFMMGGLSAVMAVLGPLELYGLDQAATLQAMGQWWWIWVLLVGLLTLGAAAYQARDDEPEVYAIVAVIGIGLLAVGTWLGQEASPWVIAPAWIIGGGLTAYGAWEIRDDKPAAGWTMLLVAVACLGVAVAAPFVLPGRGGGAGDVAAVAAPNLTAWLSAAASAVWETVRSGWGILYLAMAFMLGSIWSHRWGGIVALLALLGVIGWTAGLSDIGYGRAAELLSESPASLTRLFLSNSGRWFGSPGWGTLLLGAAFAVAVLPSVRGSVAAQLEAGTSGGVAGLFGTSVGLRRQGADLEGGAALLLILAYPVMLVGLVVSLWMGLQGLPTVAGTASFLGIPDITVPSFAPVWHPSYFLVGLAVGVVTVANQRMYRRVGLRDAGQRGETFGLLLGSILLALVVPAGVLLFLLSQNLVVGTATVLVGRRAAAEIEKRRKARPGRSADEEAAEALLRILLQAGAPQPWEPRPTGPEPQPKPKPVLPRPKREPTPPLAGGAEPKPKPVIGDAKPKWKPPVEQPTRLGGETVFGGDLTGQTKLDAGATVLVGDRDLLYRSPKPLVDLLAVESDAHLLLHQDGHLARWHDRRIEDIPGVILERPVGLSRGKDGEAIAADGANRLLRLRISNGAPPQISEQRVELTIGCFAVNPFGTIVAYAPVRRPDVLAVLLATGDQQVLAEGVGGVTAMAFSTNGRVLALGLRDGPVRLLDMSTRRVALDLAPPTGESSRVVSLAQCPDRGWVAAYRSGRLVQWDEAGTMTASRTEGHRLSSLAVCGASGRVAVGSTDGHVLVHPADLDRLDLDAHNFADEVVRVAFESDQGSLVSAGRDGTVRRATL